MLKTCKVDLHVQSSANCKPMANDARRHAVTPVNTPALRAEPRTHLGSTCSNRHYTIATHNQSRDNGEGLYSNGCETN